MKLLGIAQSQYSRIKKVDTEPNKHLKKLSKIFSGEPNEFFHVKVFRKIEDGFLNNSTNDFHWIYHERKTSYVNLKIEGWFTRKQVIDNYKMLLCKFDEWKVNKDRVRWKYKRPSQL